MTSTNIDLSQPSAGHSSTLPTTTRVQGEEDETHKPHEWIIKKVLALIVPKPYSLNGQVC